MSFQTSLASAITRMENVNPSYNNPGAIWDMSTNSVRRYPTYEEGYQALLNTINSKISRGHTLSSFFAEYAPLGHGANNPYHYARTLGGWLGVAVDVPLTQLVGSSHPLNPNPATPQIPGTGFSITSIFGGEGIEPNWLVIGAGVGAVIWMLTD